MPLDVWIYGSGFGESILLMWDVGIEKGSTERRAAFIDCYGTRDYESHPALCKWQDVGYPSVALACVTHPHLDHIQHATVMMAAAGCTADKVLWWGGQDLQRTRAFFAQMKEDLALKEQELGKTAEMTWRFLNDLDALEKAIHKCRPADQQQADILTAMGGRLVFSEQTTDGPIQFYVISPWLGPQTTYTRWIDSQIFKTPRGKTEVRPNKGVANCTSLGFLIQYGNAQVLLGGDMEADNWACFHDARTNGEHKATLSALEPCLIKVSHHGSSTGEIDGMWESESGFFGSLQRGGQLPHCVITPWRMGNRRWHLPDPEVIERIIQAKCNVWVTATNMNVGPIDRITHIVKSFIHFAVDPELNKATVVEHLACNYYSAPLTPPIERN